MRLLNRKYFSHRALRPSKTSLYSYEWIKIDVLGTIELAITTPFCDLASTFFVVRRGTNILGLDLFHALGYSVSVPQVSEIVSGFVYY